MKFNGLLRQCIIVTMLSSANLSLAADLGQPVSVNAGQANPLQLTVREISKTMRDQKVVKFWVYCDPNTLAADCVLPGPTLELNLDNTAVSTATDFSLTMPGGGGGPGGPGGGMWPRETGKYAGHTIHPHGLDVVDVYDGVPETNPAGVVGTNGLMSFAYQFPITDQYVGSHMYHCHVHTVKHLEMGMYGAFIVRSGNKVNAKPNSPAYDDEWIWVLSTVDPRYHADTAVGDDVLFASYDPQYFLVNGHESGRIDIAVLNAPSETKSVVAGSTLVIRLMGLHSLNAEFKIQDAAKQNIEFTVYNIDGFALDAPQTVNSVEVSPGQTKDIIVTIPDTPGVDFIPQITYYSLQRPQPPASPSLTPLNPSDTGFGTVYARYSIVP